MQKEVHVLGPLLPPGYGTKIQNNEEGTSVDIETFLGEMQVQHGERSVFFVRSFPFFLTFEFYTIFLFFFPDFFWLFPLSSRSGIRWRIAWRPDCKESTICTLTAAATFHAVFYDSCLLTESDFCLSGPKCHFIGATEGKNQIIWSGNCNEMVPTAIYFKPPGKYYALNLFIYLFVRGSKMLRFFFFIGNWMVHFAWRF